jgi:alginate O-acetyltransferase complex protein AlgI
MPLAELTVLCLISKRLCVLYAVYVFIGFVCAKLLKHYPKKWLFAAFSFGAFVPFFVTHSQWLGIQLPFIFVSIGIAYAMLKIIDVFYFVYYTGEDIEFLTYADYILLLPVFTSGPIFRWRDFVVAHANPIELTADVIVASFKRIIRGMFKKVVCVKIVTAAFDYFINLQSHWYVSMAIIVMSYLILYLDLSGYSDIAIAFGKIAGYNVPENFKNPWLAPTFTQFWRSWHTTLSDWIREHIYVVIGRRKRNRWFGAFIALCTMVIMGLWHKMTITGILCGVYLGLLLAFETLLGLSTVKKKKGNKCVYSLRCFAVNFLFALNTLAFFLPPDGVISVLKGIFII